MSVCDRSELMVILKVITAEDLDQAVRLEGVEGVGLGFAVSFDAGLWGQDLCWRR